MPRFWEQTLLSTFRIYILLLDSLLSQWEKYILIFNESLVKAQSIISALQNTNYIIGNESKNLFCSLSTFEHQMKNKKKFSSIIQNLDVNSILEETVSWDIVNHIITTSITTMTPHLCSYCIDELTQLFLLNRIL